MLYMRVLACVAMLPALLVAERFFIGGCGWNFDNYVTPIAHTEQGLQDLKAFSSVSAGKLYLWEPNNNEKDFTDFELSIVWVAQTFSLSYKRAGVPARISGTIKYQFQPKMMILLRALKSDDHLGIFSFNNNGEADLYPLYISSTDLILRGCVDVLLGRVESLYVLTNQDYSVLDATCPIAKIRDVLSGWEIVVAP